MRGRGSLTPLGSVVAGVIREHPVFTANPIGDWQDIVGEQGAAASRPVSLKNKTLLVVARNSVWKHQLEMNRVPLLARINGTREQPLVERLVIRVGELPQSPPELNPARKLLNKKKPAKPATSGKKRKAPRRKLTPEEKTLLKTIKDPELRSIGQRLLQYTREEGKPEGEGETG